jgi:hypothetical protein
MRPFIKLTSTLINPHHIKKILLQPNKIYIHFVNPKINGVMFMGSATIDSSDDVIEICEKKSPEDYEKMLEWIDYKRNDYITTRF